MLNRSFVVILALRRLARSSRWLCLGKFSIFCFLYKLLDFVRIQKARQPCDLGKKNNVTAELFCIHSPNHPRPPSYLEPNRNSMHKPIGGRSLLTIFAVKNCLGFICGIPKGGRLVLAVSAAINGVLDCFGFNGAGKVYFVAGQYDVKLQADKHSPLGCGRKAEPQANNT